MRPDSAPLRGVMSAILVLGQAAILWSGADDWLGHGPLTGAWLVTASLWPGVVAAAMGALLVVLPSLTRMEPYHRTAVLRETELLKTFMVGWVRSLVAAQVLVFVGSLAATAWVGAYGWPSLWNVILALAWPVFGLVIGVAGTSALPGRARAWGLALFPVLMFYLVAGAAHLEPGPVASLSPVNVLVTPDSSEPWWATALRVLMVLGLGLVIGARLLGRGLAPPGLVLTTASLVTGVVTLPASPAPLAGAELAHCRVVEEARVCWPAWGRAGSGRFLAALTPVLQRTPSTLRPELVAGSAEPIDQRPGRVWVGYPNATSTVTVWPQVEAVQRAYAEGLVRSSCAELQSPVETLFIARAHRALGVDTGNLGPGAVTEEELLAHLSGPDQTLMQRLAAADDAWLFAKLEQMSREPSLCSADAATWLQRER